MNRYKQHQQLVKKFKVSFQEKFPTCRIKDCPVGLFKTIYGGTVKIGDKGDPDLMAFVPTKNGIIVVHFEIKTGSAVLSKKQKEKKQLISLMNGKHFVVREDYGEILEELELYFKKVKLIKKIDFTKMNTKSNKKKKK